MNTIRQLEEGILVDESHHISHVVWSSVVERSVVAREVAGANPVTPPKFKLLDFQRAALRAALEGFRSPAFLRGSGRTVGSPLVAQLVERRPEESRVDGSSPSQGAGKRKTRNPI